MRVFVLGATGYTSHVCRASRDRLEVAGVNRVARPQAEWLTAGTVTTADGERLLGRPHAPGALAPEAVPDPRPHVAPAARLGAGQRPDGRLLTGWFGTDLL